jgi:hypothetical protein
MHFQVTNEIFVVINVIRTLEMFLVLDPLSMYAKLLLEHITTTENIINSSSKLPLEVVLGPQLIIPNYLQWFSTGTTYTTIIPDTNI